MAHATSKSPLLPSPAIPPATPDRQIRGDISWHTVALALYIVLAVAFTLPGSVSPKSALLGYPGDNFQHAWFLWHFAKAVSHGQNPFYTNLLFYPNRVNLAWSTTDPLAATLALPLSFAAGPAAAYNLSVVLQLALSAFFARLLYLRITRNEIASLLGGAIFGLSPFLIAHALGHLSLITAFPIPLFFLVLDRVLSEQHASWYLGALLGISLLLAAFAHFDYAVLCVLGGFLWLVTEVAIHLRRGHFDVLLRVSKPLAVGVATFLLGFSPVLRMLVGAHSTVPVWRGMDHLEQYSADVLGFLIPSWNHVLLGSFVKHLDQRLFIAGFEGTVYIGIPALVLAAFGLLYGRITNERWVITAINLGLAFYLLSLGPSIRFYGRQLTVPGPAAVFYHLPFARFFSAPARFHLIVALSLGALCSLGLTYLLDRYPKKFQHYVITAACGVLIIGDYLTVPFPMSSVVDPASPSYRTATPRNSVVACTLPQEVRTGAVLTFPLLRRPYCMKSMWMQVTDDGRYALFDGYLSYTPQEVWIKMWDTSLLRSLLAIQHILDAPIDVSRDRQSARYLIHDLRLSAVVVFDSPESGRGLAYLENVFDTRSERAGSCTILRVNSSQPVSPNSLTENHERPRYAYTF